MPSQATSNAACAPGPEPDPEPSNASPGTRTGAARVDRHARNSSLCTSVELGRSRLLTDLSNSDPLVYLSGDAGQRMKRIGLLGGMSWESSAEYYRLINEEVRDRLGGLHSADCLLRSVDFAEIEQLQRDSRWNEAGTRLAEEARALVAAGAELLALCTNTMHKVASAITDAVEVPFVHIADATAQAVRAQQLETVGLLATAYTMEQDFYVGRLREKHGLNVLVPRAADRDTVHDIIYDELCVGVIDDGSREQYRRIMRDLADRGAEGILLGCTEIDLLVGPADAPVPVFDTTRLHTHSVVDLALA